MALQFRLSIENIADGGEQFAGKLLTGTVRLKCWPEGATVPTDPTVLDVPISAPYKKVEGLTVDEQLNRWAVIIARKAQRTIDTYNQEQALKTHQKLIDKVTAIQGNLIG